MTGAAEQHPWKFCPACGAAGNDYEGGGNALCFHCGACPYLECADDHLLEERSVVAEGEDTREDQ